MVTENEGKYYVQDNEGEADPVLLYRDSFFGGIVIQVPHPTRGIPRALITPLQALEVAEVLERLAGEGFTQCPGSGLDCSQEDNQVGAAAK